MIFQCSYTFFTLFFTLFLLLLFPFINSVLFAFAFAFGTFRFTIMFEFRSNQHFCFGYVLKPFHCSCSSFTLLLIHFSLFSPFPSFHLTPTQWCSDARMLDYNISRLFLRPAWLRSIWPFISFWMFVVVVLRLTFLHSTSLCSVSINY